MAAAVAAPGLGSTVAIAAPATALTSEQALEALKEGNRRFVAQPQLCSIDLAKQRESVAAHQAPWAI